MPLAMSDLSRRFMVGFTAILLIQFLKVCDLNTETRNLFTKHCEMIHVIRITHLQDFASVSIPSEMNWGLFAEVWCGRARCSVAICGLSHPLFIYRHLFNSWGDRRLERRSIMRMNIHVDEME
jgi:hypothetical protein